ncbi:signal peptidase II [Saccharicrinis sp. FJH2]|uniref:signal peptidase II n=1 Tax=Saccharicrinis sp. FJH65 TaxID=3344659 RepID=UPI0035F37C96
MSKKGWISISLILLILVFDQIIKIVVKTQPLSWIHTLPFIDYTENNGMAFGIELPGKGGKYFLTIFRLIASVVIAVFLVKMVRKDVKTGIIVGFSLILAGALGNIIDSVFYGVIFGYAPILHGRVVDMFHFNLFHFFWPKWIPYFGGKYFEFFAPIFNVADSSITVGIGYMLIFQRRFFKENKL